MAKKIADIKNDWLEDQISILVSKGTTKAEISRRLNVLPQYLNSITKGNRGITDCFLDKFIATFKLNQIDMLPMGSQPLQSETEKDRYIASLEEIVRSKDDALKTKNILIEQLMGKTLL